jgi:hypothetical protein
VFPGYHFGFRESLFMCDADLSKEGGVNSALTPPKKVEEFSVPGVFTATEDTEVRESRA